MEKFQIILTPVNTELKSTSNEELCGRKYTSSPISNHVAADTDAPFACGLAPENARVNCWKCLYILIPLLTEKVITDT